MQTLPLLVGAVLFLQLVILFMLMNKKEGFKGSSAPAPKASFSMNGRECLIKNCVPNPKNPSTACKNCPFYDDWVKAGKPLK